jgi:hypothetical protein
MTQNRNNRTSGRDIRTEVECTSGRDITSLTRSLGSRSAPHSAVASEPGGSTPLAECVQGAAAGSAPKPIRVTDELARNIKSNSSH